MVSSPLPLPHCPREQATSCPLLARMSRPARHLPSRHRRVSPRVAGSGPHRIRECLGGPFIRHPLLRFHVGGERNEAPALHPPADDFRTPQHVPAVHVRPVAERARNHRRQAEGLLEGERRCGPPEIPPGRRIHTEDPVPPFDQIHVQLQDALLAQILLQQHRNDHFPGLPQGILRGREVQVLGQLLRDRASPRAARRSLIFFSSDSRTSNQSNPSCS